MAALNHRFIDDGRNTYLAIRDLSQNSMHLSRGETDIHSYLIRRLPSPKQCSKRCGQGAMLVHLGSQDRFSRQPRPSPPQPPRQRDLAWLAVCGWDPPAQACP